MGLKIDLHYVIKKHHLTIKGVIHVGAHKGQEVGLYEDLSITNIMLFEPIPKIFKELNDTFSKKYLCINSALGNFQGEVTMNLEYNNDNKSSSILEPLKHIDYYPNIVFTDKIVVKINKLDDFISHKDNFNLLVIDTQGYELEVLKGSNEFLNNIDYIICEVNKEELYLNSPIVSEIDDYLINFNFHRIETSWSWDNEVWGDALYVKKIFNYE